MTTADETVVERAAEVLISAWLGRQGVDATVEEHCQAFAQALAAAGVLPTEVEYGRRCHDDPDNVWPESGPAQLSTQVRRYSTPWVEVTS